MMWAPALFDVFVLVVVGIVIWRMVRDDNQ